MDKKTIFETAGKLMESVPGNTIEKKDGFRDEYAGIRMYDSPVIGFGPADDPLFEQYKKPGIIGPWHMSPEEWLPGAKTVISFFFPMSEEVRKSNRTEKEHGSVLWSYARIEGQDFIASYMKAVEAWFRENGSRACVPSYDPRWSALFGGKGIDGYKEIDERTYGSRWSERHAAYVAGLGTFGLSKGLITRKGIAGRFGSVITDAFFESDPRPYTGIYDYCIGCGACAARCPAGAIDPETGKDHVKCHACVSASRAALAPRYGCGLCQTGVPCENGIPDPAFR